MSFLAQLRQLEREGIDLIEILGKDRHLESPADLRRILSELSRAGPNLYGELLHYLTYRRFPEEEAERLWHAILEHKRGMSAALERDITFRVAALDFLTGESDVLRRVHLVAGPEFDSILSFVNIDDVTRVFSRRYFNSQLIAEFARARRYGNPLSLLLVDLDGFKAINDRLGHVEGDAVLRKIGRLLGDSTRQSDSVCRFGGDEFAVLLPETSNSEAYTAAERIRVAMEQARFSLNGGGEARVTSSVGGATFPVDCDDVEELMALADQMCLDAKRAGKNRVKLYSQGRERTLEL